MKARAYYIAPNGEKFSAPFHTSGAAPLADATRAIETAHGLRVANAPRSIGFHIGATE